MLTHSNKGGGRFVVRSAMDIQVAAMMMETKKRKMRGSLQ